MKKMSACGEFADHLWKPGSCKNCFRPSSAHRSNSSLVHAKASADTDEDNCLNHSTSCSKPTIAVRPTVMNPDTLDMLTDVNMNTEQDNQKYVIDKLSLMEMLELAPFYRGKNGCSKTMKEVVMQNTASRKMDYLCRFSCNTLSLSAHKDESLFISSIQEEGHRPLGLKENGASSGFRLQVTDPVKSNSHTRGSIQEPERTTSSSGSSDGYRGIASAGLTGQKQEAALAIAIGSVTTAPTSPVRSRYKEPPNASDNLTLEHNCSCASSFAEPTGASDFCSYPSRMDSCSCLKGQSWSEKPQTLLFLPSLPSETKSSTMNSEPIYAESTKRKKKAFVGRPSQHCSALDGELAVDSQRAKNNTVTGNTGQPNSQILYLKSSGSPVSILFPHSSTSCKDSRCCNFQCCCSNTEANTGSFRSRPQISPPIPPKRSSPKFETACLSPSPHPEVHLYPSVPTQFLYLSQTRNKAQGQVHTPIPPIPAVMALEPRNTLHTAQIEEEEGGKETVPQCGTPRYTNAATVLEPQDWSPTVHSKESTPPGTAHSGVSQLCLDKHKGSMLANGTSSTATLREGKTKTHDTMPPPPPPKKHHRVSSKMNKPTSDLEKTTWNDSVESFAQPLRILPGGLTTTTFEGLGSIPRIFSDGGH
ncbi:hypothetical protein SKAU_G00019360 [Synaphobranchus kaupii]|uniref:Uncharacterized protein n=1 Tax=Synaphobranchus kaupii TaxID=118154 RepID=A0A9Q1GCJ1_SYNKA|nr:hypothetical protein SKAU_G00019360 [Synaphobranchus kaupii]